MPADASSAALRTTPDADGSAWLSRRPGLDKNALGVNVTDAFSQIFAATDTQNLPDRSPREGLAPRDPEENSAPSSDSTPHVYEKQASYTREKPASSISKADSKTENDKTASDTSNEANNSGETKACSKRAEHDKLCKAKDADAADKADSTDTADTDTSGTDPDASLVQTQADSGKPADPTPTDDTPRAVLCLATALQAQETNTNGNTGEDATDSSGAKEKSGKDSGNLLSDLLSFRANSQAGVEKAGKKCDPAATPQVAGLAGGANADSDGTVKLDTKDGTSGMPLPTTDGKKADANTAQNNAPQGQDFTSLFQNTPEPKKETLVEKAQPEKPFAAPDKFAAANAADVSQSPPAAGSRVNAPLGFSAPPPTGSGGGSPPPAKGGEILPTAGIANTQATEAADASAPVQLARAPRGTANLPPSEQVALTLTRMAKSGVNRFDIELHPADLGKVDIRLEIGKDGMVRATVSSDNPATLAVLQKDSSSLEKVLQQAGLQTDAGSLSFNLRDQAQEQPKDAWQNNLPGFKRWNDNVATVEQGVEAQAAVYTLAPGRVDLTI